MEKKSDQAWTPAELPEEQRAIIVQPGKTLRWGCDAEHEAQVQLLPTRTETTIVQSVTITRTQTIVGPAEHTVIDGEQLPAKLRAAEFWARHASGGATTRVLIHEHDPELKAAIEAAARRSEPKRARVALQLKPPRDKRVLAAVAAGVLGLGALASALYPSPSGAPRQPTAHSEVRPQAPQPARPSPAPAVAVAPAQPSAAAPGSVSPRSAVDALIAGQYSTAIERYRALARAHPDQPAYEAAARILSRRAGTTHTKPSGVP